MKDILIVQRDWNAKVGEDARKDWKGTCGPYSNAQTNERGLLLLEFASYNDLFLTNTFGPHKPPRRWSWHSPNGKTHMQIDYIMVKKRFRSSVNINRIRSFPGADVGSDHELLMMTFRLRMKRIIKPTNTRIQYDLEKLKDPTVAKAFQANICGKCTPLILLENENNDIDTMVTVMNTAVTETANEILGKHRRIKKPWVTSDILDLSDKRRELNKKKGDTEGRGRYKKVNSEIRNILKNAKEKLKDPTVANAFQAKICGKCTPLILLEDENNDIDTMVTVMNTAVTETANEILGKHRRIKKPWVTSDILDLCDKRRELNKKKGDTEGRERYKKVTLRSETS